MKMIKLNSLYQNYNSDYMYFINELPLFTKFF